MSRSSRRTLVSQKLRDFNTGDSAVDQNLNETLRDHTAQVFEKLRYFDKYTPDNEITAAEIAAGVTPTSYFYPPGDARRYGATGDGSTNDRASLANADLVGPWVLPKGTYRVSSNLTLSNPITFLPGAILKPDSGVTVSIRNAFNSPTLQIFDLSSGGLISLPRQISTVYADWWGALGDGAKLNNNIPINQAISALSQSTGTVDGVYGGCVRLLRGTYYISAECSLNDEIALVGDDNFFTNLIAAPSTFGVNSYMVRVANGTSSLFNSPVKNMRINASNDGNIKACIYAPAWQQKSGSSNLWVENFKNFGILIDTNYGGSAQLTLSQTEVFQSVDCFSGSRAIKIDATTYSVGWLTVNLKEVQCGSTAATVTFTGSVSIAATSATLSSNWTHATGAWWVTFSNGESRAVTLTNGATTATWTGGLASGATANATGVNPNTCGIDADGRVILNADDIHFEQTEIGVLLNHDANLIGDSIKSDGSGTVPTLVQCSGAWTGQVNVRGMKRAGSTTYILDNSRGPYPLANVEPYDGITIWPPSPSKAFAAAQLTGGAGTPTVNFGSGFSPLSRVGAGQYRINLSTAAYATANYYVLPVSLDSAAPQIAIVKNSASQFDVFTKSAAGAATDCATFALQAFHSS